VLGYLLFHVVSYVVFTRGAAATIASCRHYITFRRGADSTKWQTGCNSYCIVCMHYLL